MSLLDQPGDLSRTPLAAILLEVWNERLSGALSVEQGGGSSRLFFREGVPAGAQVYAGFRPLGQFLLSKGLIDLDVLERCLAEMARSHRPQGEILVEMGAIDSATLDAALSEQQAGYVALIAALRDGAYRFDAKEKVPPWTGAIRMKPLRAIVDALSSPQAESLVRSALSSASRVSLSPGYADLSGAFGWTLAEEALVAGLPGRTDALLAASALPAERARAALAALLLLGLADGAPEEGVLGEEGGEVVDLADIAISPSPPAAAPPAPKPPAPPPSPPGKRSDPEEARARRQRLLSRAIENMGLRPLPVPRTEPAKAPEAAREAQSGAEVAMRRALQFVLPRAQERDLFARLGLTRSAGPDDAKAAYHQLVRQFHPDKYALPALSDLQPVLKDLLSALNEAYATLSDKAKRAEYLARLGGGSTAVTKEAVAGARVDFQKGEACHRTRDFARARQFFEAAIQADPRAEYQVALAGTILADPRATDRGRLKELVAEAAKDPTCDRAHYLAGVLARQEGDEAAAEKAFRAAVQANAGNAEAARELRRIEAARPSKVEGRGRPKG